MNLAADKIDGLLPRARAGDEAALNSLFAQLTDALETTALREMGLLALRWDEPQDVVQRVLIEMMPEIKTPTSQLDGVALVRIMRRRVRHRILDIIRNRRRDAGWSKVPVDQQHPMITMSGHLERRDILNSLNRQIDKLAPRDATIVRGVALEQRTYADVADSLGGTTAEAVRKRYKRALKQLEGLLGHHFSS